MKVDIVNHDDVKELVDRFCKSAASDQLLGPIFSNIANSQNYKAQLYEYWTCALLAQQPPVALAFPAHIHAMFSARHFVRWLDLFLDTIDSMYEGETATRAKVILIKKSEQFQSRLEIMRF